MKKRLYSLLASAITVLSCDHGAIPLSSEDVTGTSQSSQIRLEVDGNAVVINPSEEELRAMLWAQSESEDSFFVLSESPQIYMQGAMQEGGRFHLEYQEGSTKHHFEAGALLTADETLPIVTSYVRGNDAWRKACEWKKMDL